MNQALNTIRRWDFNLFRSLYDAGLSNRTLDSLLIFFSKYGILIFFMAFIYLIWNKRINALICAAFAMGLAGSIDLIIYFLWKRPRPFVSHADIVSTSTAGFRVDITSFPSSHTYIAFGIATAIYLYGHKKLGAALYIFAALVAVSRVGTGLHYPSDIIGGALLGISSGIIAYLWVLKAQRYWQVEPEDRRVRHG